jgi:hypothetical protein
MIDYIVTTYATQFEDITYKYSNPNGASPDVIINVINEFGFEYITSVMSTITNFEFNQLLSFLSLINLLKGSRQGLELVMILLGFDSVITEWWQATPQGTPFTYTLLVIMNNSIVANPTLTLNKLLIFARAYVYPTISNYTYQFDFQFVQAATAFAGFGDQTYDYSISTRI